MKEHKMKRSLSVVSLLVIILIAGNVNANDEWQNYVTTLRTGPISDRARIASVPSSPPQTKEQLKALRYHKTLLLKDLKEVRRDIKMGNYPQGSNALFQTEGAYEMKIQQINKYLRQK
jgi:hypothetical protein